jgi:hypothetical protein
VTHVTHCFGAAPRVARPAVHPDRGPARRAFVTQEQAPNGGASSPWVTVPRPAAARAVEFRNGLGEVVGRRLPGTGDYRVAMDGRRVAAVLMSLAPDRVRRCVDKGTSLPIHPTFRPFRAPRPGGCP